MAEEGLHENHRSRVRGRFIEQGLDAFAEHEALELLLYYVYPRRDTNAIAHRFLNEFGSLPNLLEADVKDVMDRCGVTENTAVLIHLIPSLARFYFNKKWGRHMVLKNASEAGRYVADLFIGQTAEIFMLLCLDTRKRLIKAARIAEGTLDQAFLYPREIVKKALQHQASAVILAHNHPGGSAAPSESDVDATLEIIKGLAFIGIEVTDHIIAGGGQYYSFAAQGRHVAGY